MLKNILFIVLQLANISLGYSQTLFSLRADGTILKNNKPFFPMGFYVDRNSIAGYKAAITSIAEGGFNVVDLPYVGGDKVGWTSFLDLCSNKNVYVESQLYYDEPVFEPVDLYKDHSAIFAWSIADDADNGYFTLDQMKNRNTQCKAKDPKHLTFITLTGYYLGRRNAADNYTNIADASGYQCYPLNPPNDYDVTSSNALTQTYIRTLLYVKSATKVNKPMILNSQTFSWGNQSSNPRFPTVAEIRNMTYSGLAAGIKGIISYVFNKELVNQTKLWNEIKLLRKDIIAMETMILDGKLTQNTAPDAELVTSFWELGDTCMVIVANTTYNNDKILNLKLPTKYVNHVAISMQNRILPTLNYSNSTLSGVLQNQDVQVYKLIPDITTRTEFHLVNNTSQINLHPNPAKNELFFTGNIAQNTTYEITSTESKSLQSGMVNGGSISIENLKAGIYFIKIGTKGDEKVERFVKE